MQATAVTNHAEPPVYLDDAAAWCVSSYEARDASETSGRTLRAEVGRGPKSEQKAKDSDQRAAIMQERE